MKKTGFLKENILKKQTIIFLSACIAIIVAAVLFFRMKNVSESETLNPLTAVPDNAYAVFQINDIITLSDELLFENSYWHNMSSNPVFSTMNNWLIQIDSLKHINTGFSEFLKRRTIISSIHAVQSEQLTFLFVFSAHRKERQVLENMLTEQLNFQQEAKNKNITKFKNKETGEELFVGVKNQLVVVSRDSVLLTQAVSADGENNILNNEQFSYIYRTRGKNAVFNLFFNGENLKYAEEKNSFQKELNNLLTQSGWTCWDVSFAGNDIQANGFTVKENETCDSSVGENTLMRLIPEQTVVASHYFIEDVFDYSSCVQNNEKNNLFSTKDGDNSTAFFNDFFDGEILAGLIEDGKSIEKYAIIKLKKSEKEAKDRLYNFLPDDERSSELTYIMYMEQPGTFVFHRSGFISSVFGKPFSFEKEYITVYKNNLIAASSQSVLQKVLRKVKQPGLTKYQFSKIENAMQEKAQNSLYFNLEELPATHATGMFSLLKEFTALGIQTESVEQNLLYQYVYLQRTEDPKGDEHPNVMYGEIIEEEQPEQVEALETDSLKNEAHTPQLKEDGCMSKSVIWQLKFDKLESRPHLVTNHKTGEKEMLIQDKTDKLYLIDKNGNILWTAQLSGKIMGDVYQIDYYNNKKLQYVFNTQEKIFIIDRNGNNVANSPYPLPVKAKAAVSVFDYEGNKEYRFAIPAIDNKIRLLTKEGKPVEGWNEKATKVNQQTPVQHVRYQGKDYILCSDENQVYILDRRGNVRVKTDKPIKKSNNPFYISENKETKTPRLVLTDIKGDLILIDFTGKTTTIPAQENWSPAHTCIYAAQYDYYILSDEEKVVVYSADWNPVLSRKTAYKPYISGKYLCLFDEKNQQLDVFDMSKALQFTGCVKTEENQLFTQALFTEHIQIIETDGELLRLADVNSGE